MSKIMRVYYDNAGHPYKDSALSTLYPIVGNEFTGANNTSEIHFYTDNLGIATWIANCKLPNGTLVNRLLVPGVDAESNQYFNLPLDSELTSVVGHLKIGLNGYAGNISIDEEELENNDLVVISGTPTIVATGIIDIAMNYSPITIPISSLTPNEYQELLAIIGSKLDTIKGIVVVNSIIGAEPTTYANGQIIYDKNDKTFYKVSNGAFVLEQIDYVPYTGATKNVVLGNHNIKSGNENDIGATLDYTGYVNIKSSASSHLKIYDDYLVLTNGGDTWTLNLPNDGGTFATEEYVADNYSTIAFANSLAKSLTITPNTLGNLVTFTLKDVNGNTLSNPTLDLGSFVIPNVPGKQATTTIVVDALNNINMRTLSAYEATLTTTETYSYYFITKGGSALTEEQARDYMEFMTGSRFLPTYNFEKPQNSIFIFRNGTMWKPQFGFNGVNGLFLFKLPVPYETLSNKVTSISSLSTDEQYPSAKCLYDNIQDVMEVANGKCQTFVLSDKFTKIDNGVMYYTDSGVEQTMIPDVFYVYNSTTGEWEDKHSELEAGDYDDIAIVNSSFDSQNNSIAPSISENQYIIFGDAPGGMTYYLLCVNDYDSGAYSKFSIRTGDIFLVIETDVPDRWYNKGYFYKLETSKVNLSNYVTTNTNQTITGAKTFSGNVQLTYVNSKMFPTYPVDLQRYELVLNTSGNLAWENNVVTVSSLAEMASNITYAKVIAPLFQGKNIELVIDAGLFLPDQQPIGTYLKLHPVQIDEVNKFIVYGGTMLNSGQYNFVPLLGYLGLNYDSVNQAITDMTPVINAPYDVEEAQIYISNFVNSYDADTILPRFYNPSATDSGTVIKYNSMYTFSKSANTTFTLDTAPSNHTPEYKAIITNTANSSIVLTFTGVSKIITNDEDNVVVSSNTITLAAGVTIEISIMNNNMVAINFNA